MPRSLIFLIDPSAANRRRNPIPGMIETSGGLPPLIRVCSTVSYCVRIDSYLVLMPVFAVNASRTFWKFSCSAPPQRDVTEIVAPAFAPVPPLSAAPLADAAGDAPPVLAAGAAVPPPFEHAMRSADTTTSVVPRRNRAMKYLH